MRRLFVGKTSTNPDSPAVSLLDPTNHLSLSATAAFHHGLLGPA
jgi:hypothetical protein